MPPSSLRSHILLLFMQLRVHDRHIFLLKCIKSACGLYASKNSPPFHVTAHYFT